jgi:hypothetical protein
MLEISSLASASTSMTTSVLSVKCGCSPFLNGKIGLSSTLPPNVIPSVVVK